MGNLGEIAYNVGKWANSGDIAEAKGNIDTSTINNANTAQEQQEMLAANKEKLETQQEAGDEFEENRRGRVINPQQQIRRDIIALETRAIRRYLPNFNGIPTIRPNNQISQAEALEYQAFSRFLQSSGRTYPNFQTAYREFQRETAQRPLQPRTSSTSNVEGLNSSSDVLETLWKPIRPNVSSPNSRHKIDSIGGKNVRAGDVNTVVSGRVNMEYDALLIRLGSGQPLRGPNGEMQIEINGRIYQTHAQGNNNKSDRLIPVSSRNPNEFFRLSRGEYKNLQEIVRNNGNIEQVRKNLSIRKDFNQNDFNRAVEVYNATR